MRVTNWIRYRSQLEFQGLRNTFVFHEENNDLRKFIVFVLIVTWATITVGIAFEEASVTPTYSMLTALVWALVGRLWGGEVAKLSEGAG